MADTLTEHLYEKLTNHDDTRVCQELSEAACRDAPDSFVLQLAAYTATKLGDALASPKTTLAWLVTLVGAPAWVLGFLVPIRESGSMVPQLFLGSWVRQLPVRKWVWVLGSVGQAACVAGLALVAATMTGSDAGAAILGLVAAFSLARALSSIASKDVLGKTIPKPQRGQLTGWASSAAGAVSVGLGLVLLVSFGDRLDAGAVSALLLFAAALWVLAAGLFSRVPESPGETGGGRGAHALIEQLGLLLHDHPFRHFVITRALLMCSALSAPFYIALAQQALGSPAWLLGGFVVAAGAASLVSAPVWGRFADRSSKSVMVAAAMLTSGIGLVVAGVATWAPAWLALPGFLPLAYFLLSVAHSGVRVGRKTYVVNLGTGNRRTDYVAVSNTAIGVLLLVVGGVGALAEVLTLGGVVAILALMGLAGAVAGRALPEVEGGPRG